MKIDRSIICLLSFLLVSNMSFAQQSDKDELTKLENAEREAILKNDTLMLARIMSPYIVVQNPENKIVRFTQIIDRVKNGKINYASFERSIENIDIIDNLGIVMGKEIIIARGTTTNSGKTVTRRFTNIWIKNNGIWKLTVRQATIIFIE